MLKLICQEILQWIFQLEPVKNKISGIIKMVVEGVVIVYIILNQRRSGTLSDINILLGRGEF